MFSISGTWNVSLSMLHYIFFTIKIIVVATETTDITSTVIAVPIYQVHTTQKQLLFYTSLILLVLLCILPEL